MISKIFMQKTAKRLDDRIVNMIKSYLPTDWQYINFINGEEEDFFKANPIPEFHDIINRFRIMPSPSHQADLFKCYFLYLYGGINIDGDAMIYQNTNLIIKDYSFFSVLGLDRSLLCNGLIGSSPKNPIIYEALKFAYSIDIKKFNNNYHLLCKNLYDIVLKYRNNPLQKIMLFTEFDHVIGESARSVDDSGKTVFIHYYKYKIIPDSYDSISNTITIRIGSSPLSVKLIELNHGFKNPSFSLIPHNFNDRFDFELRHNILIVKRADSHFGWGHDHALQITDNIN